MPKLTISASFILPDDPLQSAQAQVAILTAGESFGPITPGDAVEPPAEASTAPPTPPTAAAGVPWARRA